MGRVSARAASKAVVKKDGIISMTISEFIKNSEKYTENGKPVDKLLGDEIRVNSSNYPFVLFSCGTDEEGNNAVTGLYFSKKVAEYIDKHELVGTSFVQFANEEGNLAVIVGKNAEGEQRLKIGRRGSEEVDLDVFDGM